MKYQLTLWDWIPITERYPTKSGMYTVRDRKGRVFSTWFEKTVRGFDGTAFGKMVPSYSITEWRYMDEQISVSGKCKRKAAAECRKSVFQTAETGSC